MGDKIKLVTEVPAHIESYQARRDRLIETLGESLHDMWCNGLGLNPLNGLYPNRVASTVELRQAEFENYSPAVWIITEDNGSRYVILANCNAYTGWDMNCYAQAAYMNTASFRWVETQIEEYVIGLFSTLIFEQYWYQLACELKKELVDLVKPHYIGRM